MGCTFQTDADINYIALIGGASDKFGTPSNLVQVFNVEQQTVTEYEPLSTARDYFFAVFNPDNERIYVFAGEQNNNPDCVDDAELVEVTRGPQGICYTLSPTVSPTKFPTYTPTDIPSGVPSPNPTMEPTAPTAEPTAAAKKTERAATVIFIILGIVAIFLLMLFGDYYFARKERE